MNLESTKAKIEFSCTTVEHWTEKPDRPILRLYRCRPRELEWYRSAHVAFFVDAPALLYISCDLASLARDLRDLFQKGWQLENMTLYDFYPQTEGSKRPSI